MPLVGWKPIAEDNDDADAPTEECPLTSAFLEAWTEGNLSGHLMQQFALMATLSPNHPDIWQVAALGAAGEQPGNITKNLLALIDRFEENKLAQPVKAACPLMDSKTKVVFDAYMEIFEPDALLKSLCAYEGFDHILGLDLLEGFWGSVRDDDPKNIYLLMESGIGEAGLSQIVPSFIHGEKVEVSNDDSIMVWHMGSVLSSQTSLLSGLVLGIAPSKVTVPNSPTKLGTWDEVWKSHWVPRFVDLLSGKTANGDPVHERIKGFCIWDIDGDHEHHCNGMHQPHWNNRYFCWSCSADKNSEGGGRRFPDGKCGASKRPLMAEHEQRLSSHPIYTIPGVSSHNNMHDALHNLWANGVANHACGSALHSLCWKGPGRQPLQPSQALAAIFQCVQVCYVQDHTPSRFTNLQLKMFCDPDKPHQGHAMLKSKAAECKHFVSALAQICDALSDGSQHDMHRAGILSKLAEFGKLLDEAPMFPSDAQADLAVSIMCDILKHADWLRQDAASKDSGLWHIVFKHHFAEHLAESFRYMNPRYNWCFKAEDFVGRIATLAHSCSFGVRAVDLPGKVMAKWRIMYHFKLSRRLTE